MSFELPAGLAEPLHILEPTWQKAAAFVILALSLALTLLVLRRWRRRGPIAAPPSVPPPPSGRTPARSGIAGAIRTLRETYLDADPRLGCHQLSLLLRGHFESTGGRWSRSRRLATLTAREVGRLLGKRRARQLFYDLSGLQFRRSPPSSQEFGQVCERALALVGRPERG